MECEGMMELILILLTGTLMGAFFLGFFLLGMRYQRMLTENTKEEEGLEVNEQNIDGVKELYKWLNYGGKK